MTNGIGTLGHGPTLTLVITETAPPSVSPSLTSFSISVSHHLCLSVLPSRLSTPPATTVPVPLGPTVHRTFYWPHPLPALPFISSSVFLEFTVHHLGLISESSSGSIVHWNPALQLQLNSTVLPQSHTLLFTMNTCYFYNKEKIFFKSNWPCNFLERFLRLSEFQIAISKSFQKWNCQSFEFSFS